MVRDLGKEILVSHGYQVVLANDGAEALEIYQRNGGDIDLVVLDLLMPNLAGEETLNRLKELDSSVKVVFCSGYSSRKDDTNSLAARTGTPLVHKPFRPEELVAAVRQMLDSQVVPERDGGEKRGVGTKVIPFRS